MKQNDKIIKVYKWDQEIEEQVLDYEIEGISLELNKVYKQVTYLRSYKHYKIVFTDDLIAVGKLVYYSLGSRFISNEYCIFNKNNGMLYNCNHVVYRLEKEIKNRMVKL